jgi:DNA processing protein
MLDVLLWSYSLPGVGSKMVRELWEVCRKVSDPLRTVVSILRRRGLVNREGWNRYEPDVEKLKERLSEEHCSVLPFWSESYPAQLKEIPDYPAFLFVRGSAMRIPDCCVAIVGTRLMSEYGRQVVRDLVGPLGEEDIGIVSGLAYGVDSAVHERTVDDDRALSCLPIAVLPGGYPDGVPYGNRLLYQKVIEKGCAVWEFLSGVPLSRELFACRNRIIAGLSTCVVIVESDLKGGSLITSQLALDYGRDVCAVPGSVYSRSSRGTNSLLRDGAHIVRDGYDILEILGVGARSQGMISTDRILSVLCAELSVTMDVSQRVVEQIKTTGMAIEDLSALIGNDEVLLRSVLTKLELKGILRRSPAGLIMLGKRYS